MEEAERAGREGEVELNTESSSLPFPSIEKLPHSPVDLFECFLEHDFTHHAEKILVNGGGRDPKALFEVN